MATSIQDDRADLAGNTALWLVVALLPMVVSQLIRLHQTSAAGWVICDYSGRLATLATLLLIPATRKIAFKRQPLQISFWQIGLWSITLLFVNFYVGAWISWFCYRFLPDTQLGVYPEIHGPLRALDLSLGLILVAFSEEILFRRCSGELLQRYLGNRSAVVIASSVLFAAYHWWAGIPSMLNAMIFGALAMLFFQRVRALWPVVLAHYVTDIIRFGL